jgi:hypothetical protein
MMRCHPVGELGKQLQNPMKVYNGKRPAGDVPAGRRINAWAIKDSEVLSTHAGPAVTAAAADLSSKTSLARFCGNPRGMSTAEMQVVTLVSGGRRRGLRCGEVQQQNTTANAAQECNMRARRTYACHRVFDEVGLISCSASRVKSAFLRRD